MRIYFSSRILEPRSGGGIVGYFLGLVDALARHPELSIHTSVTSRFDTVPRCWPKTVVQHDLPGSDNATWAANERRLIEEVNPDWIVYSYPDVLDIYDKERSFRVATCIPDLQHLTYPYFFEPVERLRRDKAFGAAVESADLIFTLSKYSQADLARTYGCDQRRLKVVHPACGSHFLEGPAPAAAVDEARAKFTVPARYAIYPANFWPHKNHQRLLAAMRRLRRHGVAIPLVLVGDTSLADDELKQELQRAAAERWLWVPGYVSDEELHALVSGATCLLFPSLFEGFGIPVAEALMVGLRVACSSACSLPEVGGSAVRYFDPWHVESMAEAIEEVWTDAISQAPLSSSEIKPTPFTYERSAVQFLRALSETPQQRPAPQVGHITMIEPPLVSIVTPSYQQGQFLRQCIDSVLSQDYPHIEYFVLDGGSTDESLGILKSYGHRFFWKSEPDGGQTNAINSGLKLAKGAILSYLNSDDLLLPGAVSSVVEQWQRWPSVDLFYGRANYIEEHGEVTGEYDTRAEFQLEEFKNHCTICQPAAFWCRRIMDHVGLFDENFQTAMDYEYWQRIAAHNGLIVRIDKLLACSRLYPATKTKSQRNKVYKDVFKGQWRHWGRIYPEWWEGFLDYSKNERHTFWSALVPASKCTDLAHFLSRVLRSRSSKFQPPKALP